jgi:hypothetical protein
VGWLFVTLLVAGVSGLSQETGHSPRRWGDTTVAKGLQRADVWVTKM